MIVTGYENVKHVKTVINDKKVLESFHRVLKKM